MKKGDKVRTGFYEREQHIVRTIISKSSDDDEYAMYVADGGEKCEGCGYKGRETPPLSVEWFTKVEEE